MTVWAISDLHLSFARPHDRTQYAGRWRDHASVVEIEWRKTVASTDLVLLPGDLSMARNHRDLQPDLDWLARLPGRKVLAPGNHDVWWNGPEKIRPMLRRGMEATEGDALTIDGRIVCAARGAPIPDEADARALADWAREIASFERALERADRLRTSGEPIHALWHFPPFDAHGRPSDCVALCERFGVDTLVYGHLHNQAQWAAAVQGIVNGTRYHCVACDAIGFRPLKIS